MARHVSNNTFKDGNGKVVTSANVTILLAGTTTPATIYAAESGGAALANGVVVTSATDGSFTFYVDDGDHPASQLFDFQLSKTGFVTKTYSNEKVVVDYSPASVKYAGSYTDFATAVTAIGSTVAALVVTENETVSTVVTVPSTLQVVARGSGKFTKSGSGAVAFNGFFDAPSTQVFSGFATGDITFGGAHTPELSTAWWYDGADFGAAFNAAVGSLPTGVTDFGGVVTTPPGVYTATTEPFIPATSVPLEYRAHGVVVKSSGAISGLKVSGGGVTSPRIVRGLKIDHRGNSTALFGVNVVGGWNIRLKDIVIEAHGVSATYAGVRVANTTASDADTGSFWTSIENPWIRKRSGGDVGDIAIGILLEGNANATRITGGGLNTVTTGILIRNQSSEVPIPNAVLIDGVAFEGYTTAIHMTGATTSNIAGLRIVNNRFENGTTVFSLTGITSLPSVAPYLAGNYMVSDAGTYFNNPNSVNATLLDFHITPNIGPPVFSRGVIFRGKDGADQPIIVRPAGGGRGIHLREGTGVTDILALTWTGTAHGVNLWGNTGGVANINMRGVKGINGGGSSINSNNLRGSCTFATSATCAQGLATETDTSYYVVFGGDKNETFWVTGKTTTGFTMNSSNASSTAKVDWVLIR